MVWNELLIYGRNMNATTAYGALRDRRLAEYVRDELKGNPAMLMTEDMLHHKIARRRKWTRNMLKRITGAFRIREPVSACEHLETAD